MVPEPGFEPGTHGFSVRCSTNLAIRAPATNLSPILDNTTADFIFTSRLSNSFQADVKTRLYRYSSNPSIQTLLYSSVKREFCDA